MLQGLKRTIEMARRLARNSPNAKFTLGWMSLTRPLLPPAARILQGRAEPPVRDISTVDQAKEKNSYTKLEKESRKSCEANVDYLLWTFKQQVYTPKPGGKKRYCFRAFKHSPHQEPYTSSAHAQTHSQWRTKFPHRTWQLSESHRSNLT